MKCREWHWKTSDNLKIYSKIWEPECTIKGVICLVHGVGEHIGRYQGDAEALTAEGYILAGFDQRGFGKSEGLPGYTPSIEAYFNDINSFLFGIREQYPRDPFFLYGNSMGGILVLSYTSVRHPSVKGVIVTSPGLETALGKQTFKVFLVKLLGKVYPTFTFDNGIDTRMLSRDPKISDEYASDPLVHPRITIGWGNAMLNAIDLVFENASRFPVPILLMHGTSDTIAYPRGTRFFAEHAPKGKVTLKWWDNFKHELHTDPQKAEVFKMMTTWLDRLLLGSNVDPTNEIQHSVQIKPPSL